MFVRYYMELDLPFEDVETRLLATPDRWVPGILREAEDRGGLLLAEVGFPLGGERRVAKQVEISLGEPYRSSSKTALPITWTATGSGSLFPSMEADLEIAGLGASRTQLAISARYRPPLGAVGRALDRALMHRVAEATIKDFLDHVAQTLQAVPA
jgi:hypothetical protein